MSQWLTGLRLLTFGCFLLSFLVTIGTFVGDRPDQERAVWMFVATVAATCFVGTFYWRE